MANLPCSQQLPQRASLIAILSVAGAPTQSISACRLTGRTTGTIADAPHAVHARHAAEGNVTGMADAVHPINLGSARVIRTPSPESESADIYQLVW